jgi:hypothetical protein
MSSATGDRQPLPVVRAAELEKTTAEKPWMVRSLWRRAAVGLISGHPKLGKSWMGLELAVSVASGTPCLGRFEVEQAGKALVYLAEDSLPDVRDRIEALCDHRGLDIAGLDLYVITAQRLQLQLEAHAEALYEAVERIRPRLLLLDPLVRLHRLDENRSYEMAGLLDYLRGIQRAFDVAVILVHHAGKKSRSHPGQALRGTGDFWAWSDSSLYLMRKGDHIVLATEHRAAPAAEPMALRLCSRPDGSATHLELVDDAPEPTSEPTLADRVVQCLRGRQTPIPRVDLRKNLRVNNKRLGETLTELEQQGRIRRENRRWILCSDDEVTPSVHTKPSASDRERRNPLTKSSDTATGTQHTLL